MENLIDVARGNIPADLLLTGARVVNVFSGEILNTNIAVKDGLIAGLGDYKQGLEELNLAGKYVIPGLIDAHFHIESSMLTPSAFAAVAVPHGTTAVVADPHEIVNVAGLEGFRFMLEDSRGLPLDIFLHGSFLCTGNTTGNFRGLKSDRKISARPCPCTPVLPGWPN